MAGFLSDLLDAKEPLFEGSVRQLEKASGHKGVDVRLIADILHKAHEAMRELGLDPKDTTGKEFYTALLARVRRDNERIAAKIAGRDSTDVEHMTPLIVDAAKRLAPHTKTWALKHTKAADLLRQKVPEKLIKHLGYADVEVLLQKEKVAHIFAAIRFSEDEAWLREFNTTMKQLTPADFENRAIEIVVLNDALAELAAAYTTKRQHAITHSKELGVVAVVPVKQRHMRGITLKHLPLILHYINEIRLYSAYFKLKRVHSEFGSDIAHILNNDPQKVSQMAGQEVHWRMIQRYFGAVDDGKHPENFRPHISPEDLHWKKAEAVLYTIDPEMTFWKNKEYVGLMFDNRPVTTNLMDVTFSFSAELPYGQQQVHHFRENLWNELFMRYMGEANLEYQVVANLENEYVAVRQG